MPILYLRDWYKTALQSIRIFRLTEGLSFVRLGSKSSDEFLGVLSQKSEQISQLFQNRINSIVKPIPIKVMLGDTTIIDQNTFDPQAVADFFSKTLNNLTQWKSEGITTTSDEDLRRVFVKLEIPVKNYTILWHMALQYHALLYYKPDNKVPLVQKELAEIMDNTINKEKELAELTDSMIRERLAAMGHKDLDEQKLFEVLFDNDKLRDEITTETDKKTDYDFKAKDQRKKDLFKELDNLLLEAYTTTSVLIDENRLVTGEEGCVCTFDLDFVKNKKKEALFDPKRITPETKQEITKILDDIVLALSN
ncbi:MAG: hypothetical protein EB160_01365 [Nitrososphaeria archaeon]|nr:hypothetical protein [Nitrososphaeria archaeon]